MNSEDQEVSATYEPASLYCILSQSKDDSSNEKIIKTPSSNEKIIKTPSPRTNLKLTSPKSQVEKQPSPSSSPTMSYQAP